MMSRHPHPTNDALRMALAWAVLLLLCALLASGCMSSRQHAIKADTRDLIDELRYRGEYTVDSVVTPVPVQVKFTVPGFRLETVLHTLIQRGAPPVILTDTASRTKLLYWRDQYGRLLARCEQAPDTITLRDTVRVAQPVVTVYDEGPWYDSFGVGAGSAALLLILGFMWLKRRPPKD